MGSDEMEEIAWHSEKSIGPLVKMSGHILLCSNYSVSSIF